MKAEATVSGMRLAVRTQPNALAALMISKMTIEDLTEAANAEPMFVTLSVRKMNTPRKRA